MGETRVGLANCERIHRRKEEKIPCVIEYSFPLEFQNQKLNQNDSCDECRMPHRHRSLSSSFFGLGAGSVGRVGRVPANGKQQTTLSPNETRTLGVIFRLLLLLVVFDFDLELTDRPLGTIIILIDASLFLKDQSTISCHSTWQHHHNSLNRARLSRMTLFPRWIKSMIMTTISPQLSQQRPYHSHNTTNHHFYRACHCMNQHLQFHQPPNHKWW